MTRNRSLQWAMLYVVSKYRIGMSEWQSIFLYDNYYWNFVNRQVLIEVVVPTTKFHIIALYFIEI